MVIEDVKVGDMELTEHEKAVVAIVRLNKSLPRDDWKWSGRLWRLGVYLEWRSKKNLWGRFGGGWNWHVGVQVGTTTVIVYLLVASVRFSWIDKCA